MRMCIKWSIVGGSSASQQPSFSSTCISTISSAQSTINMFAISKLTVILVSALGFASSVVAAPVEAAESNKLVARGPYDVHNGWASYCELQRLTSVLAY